LSNTSRVVEISRRRAVEVGELYKEVKSIELYYIDQPNQRTPY
jgi:hypothetical protein